MLFASVASLQRGLVELRHGWPTVKADASLLEVFFLAAPAAHISRQ
jgi:hypothetical protein